MLQTRMSGRTPGEAWGKCFKELREMRIFSPEGLAQAEAGMYILYQEIGRLTSYWGGCREL